MPIEAGALAKTKAAAQAQKTYSKVLLPEPRPMRRVDPVLSARTARDASQNPVALKLPPNLDLRSAPMRSHLTLLTTASALALALAVAAANAEPAEAPGAKSDITIAGDAVPSTGGMENSAAGQGADNRNTPATPQSGASSMSKRGPNSADRAAQASRVAPKAKASPTRAVPMCRRPARVLRPAAPRPVPSLARASRTARRAKARPTRPARPTCWRVRFPHPTAWNRQVRKSVLPRRRLPGRRLSLYRP
jgi:hypothetical protein